MNGTTLPFAIPTPRAGKAEITADVLTIATTSFSRTISVRYTANGQVTTEATAGAGTYTLNGSTASFSFNGGLAVPGTFAGGALTLTADGNADIYKK